MIRSMLIRYCMIAALSFLLASLAIAQDEQPGDGGMDKTSEQSRDDAEKQHAVTDHEISIDGRSYAYQVRTGYMPMNTERGEKRADIFFMAYTLGDVDDVAARPITFVFNGGPGSSSVWLHLGTAGPKRVRMAEGGFETPPPYELIANEGSWLPATDLVFIDPVGTGYSRPAEGVEQSEFSGLQEDIRSVGDFIRLYLTRYERWSSPKYLAGESYGTTRAAGLSGYLQDRHGVFLNGIMLVSSILNFQTARFDPGNDLPYVLFLPTYTATAWYHDQLPEDLQRRPLRQVLDEVERFAIGEYHSALALGADLPDARRRAIVTQLARYTGLSEEYVRSSNMRIHIMRFCKELLRDQRRTVGRLDSRFKGIDADAAGETMDHDPSMTAILGPYTATLNNYVRTELEFEEEIPYEILTGRVHPWSYGSHENRYVNVGETLREAMSKNQFLDVFIASGYYDLATPYFATDFTVDHLGLEPELQGNIETKYYESGHMMYIHEPSLIALRDHVVSFIESSSGADD